MKFRRISGSESSRLSGVMKALSRHRLAVACTLIAICFVVGAEPRKAAALIRKHQSLFPNITVGKLYDMFAAGTGLVRVQDPPQPTRKPRWRDSDDPPASSDATAQGPPVEFIRHAPAVGSDSCPGTSIASLPFSDSDNTIGADNTVTAIPGGCSTYTTVAGPDKIYTFNVVTAGSLTVTATPSGGTYDLATYLISSCPGGTGNTISSGCVGGIDAHADNSAETFTIANLAPGTYYLYIDSFYSTAGKSSGPYSLSVTGTAILGSGCMLTCPANVTTTNDPNQCGAVVNYPPPTISGSCGTITCSPPSGSFFPVGTTTVNCMGSGGGTFSLKSAPEEASGCMFTVTVNDTQPPTITCPANITQGSDPNQCGAVVNFPPPTASDNCPGATTSCSPPSGSFFPVGTTTVTCTAMDASPNSPNATCTFTVTINDTQAPVITCPANVTQSNDPNQCGAVVNYPPPTVTDNCPGATGSCTPPSGSFFPVGTTTVTCNASEGGGAFKVNAEAAGCTTITESSSQAIVPSNSISCNTGSAHTANSYWRAFTLSSFGINTAFTVQSVDIGIESATAGGSSGSSTHAQRIGKNSNTGRPASPAGGGSQPLTVNLYTSSQPFPTGFPGSLTLIGTLSTTVSDQSGTILNVPVTGTAAANSQLVVEVFTPDGRPNGNLFYIGSNTAAETAPGYITAADCGVTTPTTTAALGSPNMHIVMNVNGCPAGGCTFTVTVQDTQPPAITCPANVTVVNDPNQCGAVVTYPLATATDNCDGGKTVRESVNAPSEVTVTCSPPSGSFFPAGTTTVTCTASDASPNSPDSTCTFAVTVSNSPPVLTYSSPQTVFLGQGTTINPATGPSDTNFASVSVLSVDPGFSGTVTVNSTTGVVTITNATPIGNFPITIRATDLCGTTTDATFILNVVCPAIGVDPPTLPNGTIGVAYSQTVSGVPAGIYTYTVTSGALPIGLSLNASTGVISGTPAQGGTFSFRVTATSGLQCSGFRDYTVTIVCPTITLNTQLPPATAGIAYSASVAASPAGNYTYTLLLGQLPYGLTLNASTGAITELPTVAGTYNFTLKADAGNGCVGTQAYTIVVGCPTITVLPSTLPNGSVGTGYSQTLSATPTTGTYSFAVASGTLPPGLMLNTTGLLSGTPTANGTYNFTVTATSFGTCTSAPKSYSIQIGTGGCPTITLPESLPNGTVGQAYSNSVAASPSGSYNYTITSGAVPPGVTFYNSVGLLYGYPTTAGTYTFTVTATDSSNCTGSQSYTVLIGAGGAHAINDFSGDRQSDFVLWRAAQTRWLIVNSSTGASQTTAWGRTEDLAVAGDYDGDGKADLAAFGNDGHWRVKLSSDGVTMDKLWGLGTDVPVPGDYDGDGKTDIAVWRGAQTLWYILRSSDGQTQTIAWGASYGPYYDVPVPADYDGDGKTDVAVFRTSTGHWYIKRSSDGQVVDKYWGLGTDVPVPADYDGDGKADVAVWRGDQSLWYIIRSSDGAVDTKTWGASYAPYFDMPAVGDYDGDGKADIAVWRKSEGRWYVLQSSNGATRMVTQGQGTDRPVTGAP